MTDKQLVKKMGKITTIYENLLSTIKDSDDLICESSCGFTAFGLKINGKENFFVYYDEDEEEILFNGGGYTKINNNDTFYSVRIDENDFGFRYKYGDYERLNGVVVSLDEIIEQFDFLLEHVKHF